MVEWWKGMVERWNLMALNIKNEETERIVRELAALKQVSLVVAVSEAVKEKLEREKVEGERTVQLSRLKRSDHLQAFAREFSKRVKNPIHSWEIDALLYDKDGLPK
jgi:hypothetical protein